MRCESRVAKGWSFRGLRRRFWLGSDGSAAYVEEDESGDDEGVAGDLSGLTSWSRRVRGLNRKSRRRGVRNGGGRAQSLRGGRGS